ncbi:MAG: hypothetical protein MR687_10980 [Spirochaetales bacterium]|nr:hypothetical protein [Spirochaetales bacterium]
MKKMIIAFLAVTLVFSLIGCDAMLNVMEKMSNNVAGTEKKVIDDSLNAAKPVPSDKKEETVSSEDGKTTTTTKTFTQSSGEESKPLFSIVENTEKEGEVTTKTETTLSLGEGETKIDIPLKAESANKLAAVQAVLTPTDLSDVINGLKSGSKSEIETELKKPADEESKKAAAGTQKVINVLIESLDVDLTPKKAEEIEAIKDPEEKKAAETMNKALETVNLILGNTASEEEPKEMTQADVVVLTALNNVVFNNVENVVGSLATMQNNDATKEDKEAAEKALMKTVMDEATTLADIVSVVPSDMAGGILSMLDILMSSSGK